MTDSFGPTRKRVTQALALVPAGQPQPINLRPSFGGHLAFDLLRPGALAYCGCIKCGAQWWEGEGDDVGDCPILDAPLLAYIDTQDLQLLKTSPRILTISVRSRAGGATPNGTHRVSVSLTP